VKPEDETWTITRDFPDSVRVPRLVVRVRTAAGAVIEAPLGLSVIVVGKSEDCDVVVDDPKVSRRHCEILQSEDGVVIRDLGSKNGTFAGDVEIHEAVVAPGTVMTAGGCQITVASTGEPESIPISTEARFGEATGGSIVMRELFARLRRVAATDATVLLLGESGTGKELLARGIHEHSLRRNRPFVVLDCGAVEKNLLADELFGHERGAYTGADRGRHGLLAEVDGGTLFIDEVGELPLDVQAKLLRVLEDRTFQPLGSSARRGFDARIIAATHRNLRARVKSGELREDLYYRLSEVEARVPPLRERRDDIPLLLRKMLEQRLGPAAPRLGSDVLGMLLAHDWPGNVRELRNVARRLALFPEEVPVQPSEPASPSTPLGASRPALGMLLDLPLAEARKTVIARFEREYIEMVLERTGGNITSAAKQMAISRQRLYELLDQHGLRLPAQPR
jgi:two-component system, NtrC family, response regulator GlrR